MLKLGYLLFRVGLCCSVCITQYGNSRKQQEKSEFKQCNLEKDLLVEIQVAQKIFKQVHFSHAALLYVLSYASRTALITTLQGHQLGEMKKYSLSLF